MGWKNNNRGPQDPRPRNRHSSYTELNVSNSQLLGECCKVEFADIRPPKPLPFRPGQRTNKYCWYHRSVGHETDHCNALKDDIEDLIKRGKLSSYVKKHGDSARSTKQERSERAEEPRGKGKRSEDSEDEVQYRKKARDNPVMMMMITGGMNDGESMKTLKRNWKELASVVSVSVPRSASSRPLLAFGYEDFWDGKPNRYVPLIITAVIANHEVKRLLVDQGSSSDILYMDLLDRMGISKEELTPYKGNPLTEFDGSRATPIGR